MYARDIPLIKDYLDTRGEAALLDVASFVLATIQQPLSSCGKQMEEIRLRGAEATALWGFKRSGYEYVRNNLTALYEALNGSDDVYSKMETFLEVPGLGLPKASFVLQCCGYDTACMDVHNLRRYGLPVSMTKVGKVKPETRMKKIKAYVNYCQIMGTEAHWNGWCDYTAGNKMNKSLPTGDMVSAYHVECITGEKHG